MIAPPRLTQEIIEAAERENPQADPDAFYAKEFTFDLGSVTPHVAGPNEVKIITPLPEIEAEARADPEGLPALLRERAPGGHCRGGAAFCAAERWPPG